MGPLAQRYLGWLIEDRPTVSFSYLLNLDFSSICCGCYEHYLVTVIDVKNPGVSVNTLLPAFGQRTKGFLLIIFVCRAPVNKASWNIESQGKSSRNYWFCNCRGRLEGLPDRGSTQVVIRLLWSMKNVRPFGATWTDHPFQKLKHVLAEYFNHWLMNCYLVAILHC